MSRGVHTGFAMRYSSSGRCVHAVEPSWEVPRTPRRGGGSERPLETQLAKAVHHIEGEPRDVVVELVVRQAAAIGDRADREHGASFRLLDVGHVGPDQFLQRLTG